ncbi:TPA: hypothetical protein ACG8M9_002293, partial [Enterococcus faecium]
TAPNDSFWNHDQGRTYTKIFCPFDPNRLTTNLVSNIDWYVVKPANGKVVYSTPRALKTASSGV